MAEWRASEESSNGYSSRAEGQWMNNGHSGSSRQTRSSDGDGSQSLDLSKICRDGRRTILKRLNGQQVTNRST